MLFNDYYNETGGPTKSCEPDWEAMIRAHQKEWQKCVDLANSIIESDLCLDMSIQLREAVAAFCGLLLARASTCQINIKKFQSELDKQAKEK